MNRTLQTFNCAANQLNPPKYNVSTADELEILLSNAEALHMSGVWQNPKVREDFFQHLIEELQSNKSKLQTLYCTESSLSAVRFTSEFERMIQQIRLYCREGNHWSELELYTNLPDRKLIKKHLPIGPVVVFGASNFPLAYGTLGGDTVGALAVGCPVLVKGHPLHAGTSFFLAELVELCITKLGLPKGIFGHVMDDQYELAQLLVRDHRVKAGAFTGSAQGGKALFLMAQQREEPMPFFAEMGSLNPVFIMPNVKSLGYHIKQLVHAITHDAGQFCTKPGLLFYPESEKATFLSMFVEEIRQAAFFLMLHPSMVEKYESRLKEIGDAGIQVSKLTHSKNWYGAIAYAETSIQEFLRFGPLHHEVFGPFTCLVSYRNSEDLLGIWPKIKGQLTTTFIGDSLEEDLNYAKASLHSGRIIHNQVPTGVVVNPSMHHGGPFPSSSDARFTSVGEASVLRFLRPLSVQKI